jgi:hypothetical protein
LRQWQRLALRSEARRFAGLIGLTGRPANWIGMFLAVARQPRLMGAGMAELAAAVARQPHLICIRFAAFFARLRRF